MIKQVLYFSINKDSYCQFNAKPSENIICTCTVVPAKSDSDVYCKVVVDSNLQVCVVFSKVSLEFLILLFSATTFTSL